MLRTVLLFCLSACLLVAGQFKVGVGRVNITPSGPIWMGGYGSRTHPSEGVFQDIWTKALAIDDGKSRTVIVTVDLVGLPHSISDVVAARVLKQYGIDRSHLMLNVSHTHTGPLVWPSLTAMFTLTPQDERTAKEFALALSDNLVTVVGAALGDLAPARIEYGVGEAGFAVNRRQPGPQGFVIGVNPSGPVDHSVPILKVIAPDGRLRAVLFGYACHNTTLTGEFYQISGDFAGVAQAELERRHPGAAALFLQLCGGDQNPRPRSSIDAVRSHGTELADAVDHVLGGKMQPVTGPVRAAFHVTELTFAKQTRESYEAELKSKNRTEVVHAQHMLAALDRNPMLWRLPYPVQAIRLGHGPTILALAGEVVVDYDLRAKREFGAKDLIVAGYSNEVPCYIPSLRVLKEGGYEPAISMIYYDLPGPFDDTVEETIFTGVRQVMGRVGR